MKVDLETHIADDLYTNYFQPIMHNTEQTYYPLVTDFARYDVTTTPNKFWELLETNDAVNTMRGKVPGGWLISQFFRAPGNKDNSQVGSIVFVPDPMHQWKIKQDFK